MNLHKSKALYFIGIGGSGMKPLAEVAIDAGYDVLGSDIGKSESTADLISRGIKIHHCQDATNLPSKATIVYSSAILDSNPELREARKKGYEVLHRSDLLAHFIQKKFSICVCGTHGKTTTTSMVVDLLSHFELNPGFYLGGEFQNSTRSGALTKSDIFVAESDESDGTFYKYQPKVIVLTSIGTDHLDHYENVDSIYKAFKGFISNSPKDCILVCCWDDKKIRQLANECDRDFISYGESIGADLRILSKKFNEDSTEAEIVIDHKVYPVKIGTLGDHNLHNACAAIAVCSQLNLNIEQSLNNLKNFCGVKRRLQEIYSKNNISIYDDYAHNPEKIDSAINALSLARPGYKIHVIFQPHRYSRMKKMYNEFVVSFKVCQYLYVLPVFTAGEENDRSFCARDFCADVERASTLLATNCSGISDAINKVSENLSSKDVIISVGAGDVNKVAYGLRQFLENQKIKS